MVSGAAPAGISPLAARELTAPSLALPALLGGGGRLVGAGGGGFPGLPRGLGGRGGCPGPLCWRRLGCCGGGHVVRLVGDGVDPHRKLGRRQVPHLGVPGAAADLGEHDGDGYLVHVQARGEDAKRATQQARECLSSQSSALPPGPHRVGPALWPGDGLRGGPGKRVRKRRLSGPLVSRQTLQPACWAGLPTSGSVARAIASLACLCLLPAPRFHYFSLAPPSFRSIPPY